MAHVDRLLDPRTRLVGFLGSLALSMTCGAAILHWIEPANTTSSMRAALLASRRQAVHSAVATNPPPTADRWRKLQLASRLVSPGESGPTLAARPERRDFHFVVDQSGRIDVMTSWHQQQWVGGAPYAIRICLASPNVEDLPSPDQRQSLIELINVLRQQCNITSRPVELVGGAATDDPDVDSARTRLRQSLLEAGVLG